MSVVKNKMNPGDAIKQDGGGGSLSKKNSISGGTTVGLPTTVGLTPMILATPSIG